MYVSMHLKTIGILGPQLSAKYYVGILIFNKFHSEESFWAQCKHVDAPSKKMLQFQWSISVYIMFVKLFYYTRHF